jgi:hypothetical protein
MPITFYNEYEALQIPSGTNGADGLSAVSAVKNSATTTPATGATSTLFASAVGEYGYEWLKVGVFFNMPGYGVYEVTAEVAPIAPFTEKQITYRNNGAAGNVATASVPPNTLIVPAGPPGGNGTNGSTVLNFTSTPSNSVGSDGDFYINTTTNTIFGPKAAGAWPVSGTALIGSQGVQGPSGTSLIRVGKWTPVGTIPEGNYQEASNGVGVSIPAGGLALYSKLKITYYGKISMSSTLVVNKELDRVFFYPSIEFVSGSPNPTVDPGTYNDAMEINFPSPFYVDIEPRNATGRIVANFISYKVEFEFIKTASNQAISNTSIITYGNYGSKPAQNKVMNGFRIHTFNWAASDYIYFLPYFYKQALGTGYNTSLTEIAYSAELFKTI